MSNVTGSAAILISLRDGDLCVHHGTGGDLLLRIHDAPGRAWGDLWDALYKNAAHGAGVSGDPANVGKAIERGAQPFVHSVTIRETTRTVRFALGDKLYRWNIEERGEDNTTAEWLEVWVVTPQRISGKRRGFWDSVDDERFVSEVRAALQASGHYPLQ